MMLNSQRPGLVRHMRTIHSLTGGAARLVTICFFMASMVRVSHAAQIFLAETSDPIPEDVNNDEDLFDVHMAVTQVRETRTYEITGTSLSGDSQSLFRVTNQGKLRLKPGLAEEQRSYFDYEKYPQFIVNITAPNINDDTDVVKLQVTLPLSDVNDELPVFTNQPLPFLAVVDTRPILDSTVFTFTASDADTNPDLSMSIVRAIPGFDLRKRLQSSDDKKVFYDVHVTRTDFQANVEHDLEVVVRDNNSQTGPQEHQGRVLIKVGTRKPQIFQDNYSGYIYESVGPTNKVQLAGTTSPLVVEVKKFQVEPLTFSVRQNGAVSDTYGIDANRNIVNIKPVAFDVNARFSEFTIQVSQVVGAQNLISTSQLRIEVIDENYNPPEFTLTNYPVSMSENVPLGTSVVTVEASDKDVGVNGEITFEVSDDTFAVSTNYNQIKNVYEGQVTVAKELDYDRSQGPIYSFVVIAKDLGPVPMSSSARITVTTSNYNDNPPTIVQRTEPISLLETAQKDSVVFVVQATDKDGDKFSFNFHSVTPLNQFRIDAQGIIRLDVEKVSPSVDSFNLTVMVTDDGSCCGNLDVKKTSTASFIVNIVDVNRNRPDFTECSNYDTTEVKELSTVGTSVRTVQASDEDRGENGRVIYELTEPVDKYFAIDSDSGLITVSTSFTREDTKGRGYIQVTVKGYNPKIVATDPTMEGWCTFRVSVKDINNHFPTFPVSEVRKTFARNSEIGDIVVTVRATDADIGPNANITYSLLSDAGTPTGLFTVNSITGMVTLQKELTSIQEFQVTVIAKDNPVEGEQKNGTMELIITIEGQGIVPQWQSHSSIFIVDEVSDLGTEVATLYCRPGEQEAEVVFLVYEDSITSSSVNFYIDDDFPREPSGFYKMVLRTSGREFEVRNYRITITCREKDQNFVQSDINPTIQITDVNNKPPRFQGLDSCCYTGSIPEDANPGATIIDVSATDDDLDSPNNEVTFHILNPHNPNWFEIKSLGNNRASVVATAELTNSLDRETNKRYEIQIQAQDGAAANPPVRLDDLDAPNSDTRSIIVHVTDVNDESPYFNKTLYICNAPETLTAGETICIVKANDPDQLDIQGVDYYFQSGNTGNYFSVVKYEGAIVVNSKLDYENPAENKIFNLNLAAKDGANHINFTQVQINVLDMNDNIPQFTQSEYSVRDVVTEEDESITPQEPRLLIQVQATDLDTSRNQTEIRYSLLGTYTEAPNRKFTIDAVSGEISLIGVLDREESNNPSFSFNVVAKDERDDPLIGYASVQVFPIDINDNHPEFILNSLQGSVDEHVESGTSVCTVLATDADDGQNQQVDFSKAEANLQVDDNASFFRVDPSGEVFTSTHKDNLDREQITEILVVIKATDRGDTPLSSTATLTITLLDINDQSPMFPFPNYSFELSENTPLGPFETIKAEDADSDPRNKKLTYTLEPTGTFSVNSVQDSGVLTLSRLLDYESANRQYTLMLSVTDGNDAHGNSTQVVIDVTDYNDKVPQFDQTLINVTQIEEQQPGTYVATFSATDADGTAPNNEIYYAVDQGTDEFFEFFIDPNSGNVTTRKQLDREKGPRREIHIFAIDKGEIPLTGTATLIVHLTDINDNAPTFLEDYRPVIPENEKFNNRLVVEVKAKDPDSPQYGPPFYFMLPSPCNTLACDLFSFEFFQERDNQRGLAVIKTSSEFDRETQKEYHLPIIIWDMSDGTSTPGPQSQSATSTLTIVIGDKNDNPHGPGFQSIFSYVRGDKTPRAMQIGRVYAEDADDWDLPDKTFEDLQPVAMKDHFLVDQDTGSITVKEGVTVPADGTPFIFTVKVTDNGSTVTCTVSVVLETLSEQAIYKAGSIRLSGITSDEFISKPKTVPTAKSKFQLFEEQVAEILGYPVDGRNVQIVSLKEHDDGSLDVHYSAHGSPHLNPAQVESAIMLNKDKIQNGVGIQIEEVPINLCKEEVYRSGCSSIVDVTDGTSLTNANGTSFVGPEILMFAEEGCEDSTFPPTQDCTGDYCYNGGTCVKDHRGVLLCQCPDNFDGPRCQERRHNFGGNDVAFYEPLEPCADGRTSIEFITEQDTGIIMYSGPTEEIDMLKDVQDFWVLQLIGGYPRLRVNLGSGETTLEMNGRNQQGIVRMGKLSDGKWHRIDIDKNSQSFSMTVDHCQSAEVFSGSVTDWSPCRATGTTPGGDILLNVKGFLQLGNRYPLDQRPSYPAEVDTMGFTGCLRNLKHNSKIYDLSYKKMPGFNSGVNGCPREEKICNAGGGPVCGVMATCVSEWLPAEKVVQCTCHPGWSGNNCTEEPPVKEIKDNGFFKWSLNNQAIANALRDQSVDIKFRTVQTSGILFMMSNDLQQTISLRLTDGRLSVHYDLGEGIKDLTLMHADANNDRWHSARFERHGNGLALSLNGGEGRNYAFSSVNPALMVEFASVPFVATGASIPLISGATAANQITLNLVDSCVQDIRFDELLLPMDLSSTLHGNTLVERPYIVNGCSRDECQPNACQAGTCYPIFGGFECRCPGNLLEVNGICPPLCDPNPCPENRPCSVVEDEVFCGPLPATGGSDGLSGGAIAGIVIAIIIILILVAVLILFLMCRKEDDEKMIVKVDPDDDFIRENVMFYDDEGAGEMDNEGYDISVLTVPNDRPREAALRPSTHNISETLPVRRSAPQDPTSEVDSRPDVGSFIDKRINQAEDPDADPFTDSLHQFNFEGGNSDAGSLSSLNTTSSDGSQDYDFLGDWGEKFARLADMYGAGQNLETD